MLKTSLKTLILKIRFSLPHFGRSVGNSKRQHQKRQGKNCIDYDGKMQGHLINKKMNVMPKQPSL